MHSKLIYNTNVQIAQDDPRKDDKAYMDFLRRYQ